jgi:hypothetical protein
MRELDGAGGEEYLMSQLRRALAIRGISRGMDDEQILDRVKSELEEDGLHVLGGITRPYFDLMLWTFQESRTYECELTDTTQSVEVVFLGDFVVYGWSHFATFGRAYTGGWATKEKLFCLRDDYDLESEKFKVSYLQHEGRHFADYKIFPALEQIDLEYRGKLTELAFAETSLRSLIENFAASGALNPEAPHSYANACVIRDLSKALFGREIAGGKDPAWESVTNAQVHAAARKLLEENTERLKDAGAQTTKGVIYSEG